LLQMVTKRYSGFEGLLLIIITSCLAGLIKHPMHPPIPLKRELGLLEVTLSGTGIILGAGIYVLIGDAASLAGNAIWLSFAFAALIAVFTGLSYAELTSMFPTAGA